MAKEGASPGTFAVYGRLLQYAGPRQKFAYAVGAVAAGGSGVAFPLMTILFQRFVNTFNDYSVGKLTEDELQNDIKTALSLLCYIFIGKLVLTYTFLFCFSYSGSKVTEGLRLDYLTTILHGEISYFDLTDTSSVSANLTTRAETVQKGSSEKIGFCIQNLATTLSAVIIALIHQWKLSLVVIALIPILAIVVPVTYGIYLKIEADALTKYAQLTGIETEALSAMKTVKAFGMIPTILQKHQELVTDITNRGLKASPIVGVQIGVVQLVTLSEYALSFWYGCKLYVDGEVDSVGTIVLVFFALLIGFNGFTYISGHLIPLANCISAANQMFGEIDNVRAVAHVQASRTASPTSSDRTTNDNTLPEKSRTAPEIEYQNITFAYPTRPDVQVLQDFSCTFKAGKTTAVVGRSGSGKSTLLGLLERWYEPNHGHITVGGKSLESMDIRELRVGIAYVQQNTFLFNETVLSNICHGLVGSPWEHSTEEVKFERVQKACKEACAHEFIQQLPNGYHTNVGERGNNLSTGQKQRISLARSIVADPLILILDEVTSALDNRVQAEVKQAIDRISIGRTTINISHRLSMIVNADNIIVMNKGVIVEQGTHDELLAKEGMYWEMWNAQRMENISDTVEDDILENPKEALSRITTTAEEHGDSGDPEWAVHSEDAEAPTATKQAGLIGSLLEIFIELRGHWRLYVWAVIACLIGGASYPMQAFIFGKMISTFQLAKPELSDRSSFWSLMVFIVALVVGGGYTILGFSFIGLQRIIPPFYRHKYFETIISQDISFFDAKTSTTGALINRLTADPNSIQQLTGANLGLVIIGIFNMLGCSILALVTGWKLGLVAIFGVLLPVSAAGYLNFRQHRWFEESIEGANSESSSFASEAVGAIKTVATLTLEEVVYEKYRLIMHKQRRNFLKRNAVAFTFSSLSQSIDLLGMALIFWYGERLIITNGYTSQGLFTIFIATTFSAQDAGAYLAQLPDARLAQLAARRIKALRSVKPAIESSWDDRNAQDVDLLQGSEEKQDIPLIEFKNVGFSYPLAPDTPVLHDLNLKIHKGQFVAFTGSSGCGKSTTFGLIERFYDPTFGEVLINGIPLKSLDLKRYRSQMALVAQEPVLFAGTIRENLLTGSAHEDLSEEAVNTLLEETCKSVDVYDFVASLPEKFETQCTAGASSNLSFSSGQTQRLAAARVLLRNPSLLLLDEATSALDALSEAALQDVLHAAGRANGRTVIAIAHRLETIRKADLICVFHEGRIIELGSHEELMKKMGRYYEMVQA